MKIGIFDSGVGGLTVLKELISKYPHNKYIYYGDTLNNPYGNKSINELINLSNHNINFLLNKKVDIIIIACGTVSSNCYKYLKEKYKIPIYDIISPTINYLNKSIHKNIGIIATSKTIESHIFKNNVNKLVTEIPTSKLVPIIEKNKNPDHILTEYLKKYKDFDILVLGCTHYPIIIDHIKKIINPATEILNMASCLELNINSNDKKEVNIYYSKLTKEIIDITKNIINDKVKIKEEI